ncbi:DNA gyrase inhibitor YacG [Pyrinomonas methylaliphatogenes]|uniref:DNA gyrase inhibitor YacG n=1 Tax=Pyrinomonas methylaliphatogenes TaxID=454194 RepID=UPI0009F94AC5|nr:DNA gyrase inhibitor YacG [Pyrinomonas methylaliphatogenes]MBX5478912.1 DNA gyrase inhibitor YacG [Pyrinomonas methylaliphatogenes]
MTTQIKCPICGKPTQWQDNPFRPFCSERCKLIDFGHWIDEDYALPAEEERSDEKSIKEDLATREDAHD